jgi:hypothetical protein
MIAPVTGLGLMALAMAGVFSGFLLEAAVPGLPRWAALAVALAPGPVWFAGDWIRREAERARWRRRGERLERAGGLLGAVTFAGVLAVARDATLNHGEGFARAMAAVGLATSALLAAISFLRERLFGSSLEEEGRVVASGAPAWRRAWAAGRVLGEWTFVTLVGLAFTGAGLLILSDPGRSRADPRVGWLVTGFFAFTAASGVLMARQRLRALVPARGPARSGPPRRPGFRRRYRVDADGLVEYRRGVEVRIGWDLVHGVALGEFAQHMALFVLADVEPAVRAARPAQSGRWTEKRLREARQWRALAGADVVVMAMQADLPLGEMKERIARGIGAPLPLTPPSPRSAGRG